MNDAAVVLPAVPPTVGPLVQWGLTVASIVITLTLPILLAFLKMKLNVDSKNADANTLMATSTATTNRANLINDVVSRGAALAAQTGAPRDVQIAQGVQYVKDHIPETLAAVPQANDDALASHVASQLPAATPTAILAPTLK